MKGGRLLTICSLVAGIPWAVYQYRESRVNSAYALAAGIEPARSEEAAKEAVRRLASYRGNESTRLLLNIALRQTPKSSEPVQNEAIKALGQRGDRTYSIDVAGLLQPHNPMPTRRAAAETLQAIPCTAGCIERVLYYLERVWWGERNLEQTAVLSGELGRQVRETQQKDQQALEESLLRVLRKNPRTTRAMLYQIHGLGTDAASKFGVVVARRAGLKETCPDILQSAEYAEKSDPADFIAPRDELRAAIGSLGCK